MKSTPTILYNNPHYIQCCFELMCVTYWIVFHLESSFCYRPIRLKFNQDLIAWRDMAGRNWIKIFSHSDSNSLKLYPNNRFYHLQPLNDFYCYIKLSFLIFLGEKKRIHNFWTKFEIPDFFFRTLIRVCIQSLEIHEISLVYQMMIKVYTGSY